jgi:hypothetical protein
MEANRRLPTLWSYKRSYFMTNKEGLKVASASSGYPVTTLPNAFEGDLSLAPVATKARIAELEIENNRLQRLVAELLLKNQQLRRPAE